MGTDSSRQADEITEDAARAGSQTRTRENVIARALYRALKRNRDAMVVGGTQEPRTIIDGSYSLKSLARAIDQAISREETRSRDAT